MSGSWTITAAPSIELEHWAAESRFLFASRAWGSVLEALGAVPLYAWNPELGAGAVVPVFVRFGIKVGFFGFPVLGQPWDELPIAEVKGAASGLAEALGVDLLRFTGSMVREVDPAMTAARPEVWRAGLQSWTPESSKRLRKDLAFARRSNPGIVLSRTCADATACFRLYEATVKSRAGKLRYPAAYFDRLQALASTQEGLQLYTAMGEGERLRGFAVLAMHGSVAYYLHGAVDEIGRRCGVSDLLLQMLVSRARGMGASTLSLMSSPWDQAGLVRFKSKWGENSGLSVTYDVGPCLVGALLRIATRWQSRHDRRSASAAIEFWPCSGTLPEIADVRSQK